MGTSHLALVGTAIAIVRRIVCGFALNPAGRWLYAGIGYDWGGGEATSGYYVVDLVTVGVLRELGVLLTAIIVAGRSGSAFAAEI